MDETDVDSYFYKNIFAILQSHHKIVRVSKGSNKKSVAIKAFRFCDSKLQQRFILKEEISISNKNFESLFNSLREFLKALDQANKVSQIPLRKLQYEIEFTKEKDELFSHCYKHNVENLNKFRLSLQFERKTRLASFPPKSLKITLINSFLQKLSTWDTTKSNTSTKIDFMLLTSVTFLRAIKVCSVFTPDCWQNKSIITLIGDVYCSNTQSSGFFACTKRLFNLSAEAIINARKARPCVRCTKFLLKIKRILFSCILVKGFTFLNGVQNQFKFLLEMCIVLANFFSTERNANLLAVL